MSTALESALAAIDAAIPDGSDESQLLVRAKCRGLMRGYDVRWRDAGYVALAVEQMFTASLVNPETGRQSRTFALAGKIDVLAWRNGLTSIIDHKTTSQDITDPNATYWRQLSVERQPTMYTVLQLANGVKTDSAIWDVVRKPNISPKKLSKAERASAVAERSYFGTRLGIDCLNSLQVNDRETFPMYEARLSHDCTDERPEWYFARRPVPRLDSEILEFIGELWQHGQDLLAVKNQVALGKLPPRNSGACFSYSTPCAYLGICSGNDTPDSDRWTRKESVHSELPQLGGDGRDVLTNSRIACFQTCRRKEYYQYQLGLQRRDAEDSESLFFGTAWHFGQEAWWSYFLQETNDGSDSAAASPATVVGIADATAASQTQLAG